MKKAICFAIVMLVSLFSFSVFAAGQPTGAFQKDLLDDLQETADHLMSLSQAVPAEKYNWKPGEGVRSVGEVYSHIADANFGIPKAAGIKSTMTAPDIKGATGKDQIVSNLKASIENVQQIITSTPDSALDGKVKLFGHDFTVRGTLLLLVGHMHEHLGQSIAYARSIGVVPPWTAAEKAKEKKSPQSQSY
jgi:uncharacterized damage-inducible protein DinB